METKRPFVYISALMRTGSTLLSEVLTQLPYAFIFREPHIGKNDFQVKPDDVARWAAYGVDLEGWLRLRLVFAFLQRRLRRFGYRQDYMVRTFKYSLMPALTASVSQVGVKEIRNRGWRNYVRHFPDMAVVMTGRDPRDIYLSIYYRWASGVLPKREPVTPSGIAEELVQEFALQRQVAAVTRHMKVRYEDLCNSPDVMNRVRSFVRSPVPTMGTVGQFIGRHPTRTSEYALHGDAITDQRIRRWAREPDQELVAQAQDVFDLMTEYCDYWGYSR